MKMFDSFHFLLSSKVWIHLQLLDSMLDRASNNKKIECEIKSHDMNAWSGLAEQTAN